jgi:hypothetical protein
VIRSLLTIGLVASCGELRLDVPLESDTRSIVVSLTFESGETEVHAFSTEESLAVDYRDHSSVDITALTYRETLCELMMDGGRIDPVTEVGDLHRAPLAAPGRIFATIVDGGSAAEFRELGALPMSLSEFRYRDDPLFCFAHGGVYRGPGSCDCAPTPTEVLEPMPPEAPALPLRPVEVPFRDPGECPADATIWYGESACTVVGTQCPPGQWPEIVPPGTSHYVDPSAAPGGDGSMLAPFVDVDEAVDAAAPGDSIILSKGVHQNQYTALSDVALIGACVGETMLLAPEPSGVLEVRGVSIRNLFLGVSVIVGDGSTAAIEKVVVEPTRSIPLYVGVDASLQGSDVVIRGGFPGVQLSAGASVAFDGAVIERFMGSGVAVDPDASLDAVRLVLTTSLGASGVSVSRGGSVTVRDAVVSGGAFALDAYEGDLLDASRLTVLGVAGGIFASGTNSRLSDVVVRDGDFGIRIDRGRATVQRALFERVRVNPVGVQDSLVVLDDLSAVASRELLAIGSTLTLTRAEIDGFEVSLQSTGSVVDLRDVRARGSIIADRGGRALLERVESACVLVFGPELIGKDMRVDCPGRDASGIAVAVFDTIANLSRVEVEGGGGVSVVKGSMILTDASIRDTVEPAVALKADESTIRVERSAIERVGRIGIGVTDESILTATDLRIDGVGDHPSAAGIECTGKAEIERFEIRDSLSFGVRMQRTPEVDLDNGTISGNRVGVSYPSSYDLRRLSKNVVYVGNDTDLSPY